MKLYLLRSTGKLIIVGWFTLLTPVQSLVPHARHRTGTLLLGKFDGFSRHLDRLCSLHRSQPLKKSNQS